MVAVEKELLAKLPRTFLPMLNEQLQQWDLLFPAEQRSLGATLDYLNRLPASDFRLLFAALKDLESKMEVHRWKISTERPTISDISLLVRSPYYPQWRAEVERVFEQINAAIQTAPGPAPVHRMILCVLPAGVPLGSGPVWPGLAGKGRWIKLPARFGALVAEFVRAIVERRLGPQTEAIESTWVLECETYFAPVSQTAPGTVLSFDSLGNVRQEFLRRLNAIRKDLRSADQTYEDLRRLDLARLLGPSLRAQPRIREFIRNLFLSGNGALLFNNSFVEWGAAEALRRVQPQVLVCFFGVRQRPKPFSSVVLFEDQNRANPFPAVDDPAGSFIDIQILSEYVWLAADGLFPYRGRTLFLYGAMELDRILLLSPPAFHSPETLSPTQLIDVALDWLAVS